MSRGFLFCNLELVGYGKEYMYWHDLQFSKIKDPSFEL
jgi:hypothetical protein